MNAISLLICAYFLGAMPFGLIIAKVWKGVDIRDHGSGNIGATNVFRVCGKLAGSIVFLLDVIKGLWPPLAAKAMGLESWWQVGVALAAVLGHSFSPFLGFRGGKGVATSLGALFGVAWKVAVASWALWGLLVLVTGIVSVGSIAASISLAPFAYVFYGANSAILTLTLIAGWLSVFRHRANIGRLMRGEEAGFRKRKK